jgi:hypothetical protein
MRFLVMVKSDPEIYDKPLRRSDLEAMGKYNQSLRDAGVLRAVEGLLGPKEGARVTYRDGKASVKDGPFTEAKELVAGFWVLEVKSKDEAIEWTSTIPFFNGESVEIRQIAEASDLADAN